MKIPATLVLIHFLREIERDMKEVNRGLGAPPLGSQILRWQCMTAR
jgi:hypothetical protein